MTPRHNVRPALLETAALVPIDSLEHLPGNARQHDDDLLRESLVENGQYRAVVVRRIGDRRVIIAGNGTVENAAALGWTHVAVEWFEGTDREALKAALVDNKASDNAVDDPGDLAALLADLGGDYIGTGFTEHSHAHLLAEIAEPLRFDGPDTGDDEPLDADAPAPYDDEQIIDAAFDYWRGRDFPYPALERHEMLQAVNRLARTPSESLRHSTAAYGVPDAFHPHRFTTKIPGKWTPVEAFGRDDKLRHAIRLLVESATPITATSLRSMLGFVRNSQCAANFRPAFALLVLRQYAPSGGVWLDTSAGFGGRLVAFAASHMHRYVGVDPSTQTDAGNRALAAALGVDDRVTLLKMPAEDVPLDAVGGAESADVAFTSPPYFGKEQYADEPTQSFARYSTGESWRDGFLVPTLALQHAALKPGAFALVNIADVKIGGTTYPLERWTRDAATDLGFVLERTDELPISRVPGRGDAPERREPLFIFRKP